MAAAVAPTGHHLRGIAHSVPRTLLKNNRVQVREVRSAAWSGLLFITAPRINSTRRSVPTHMKITLCSFMTVILDNLGAEIILLAGGEVVRSPQLALHYCLYRRVIKCVQTAGEIAIILNATWRKGHTEGCRHPADLNVSFLLV